MMKVTLSHIGAISLGRLLAIWSFVLGLIFLVLWALLMIVLAVIGIAAGSDFVQTIVGVLISLVFSVIGLFIFAIAMFIFGFLTAVVYNVILGIGGGIDVDLKERA
jgi:uncharacterized transporter YbjL